MRTTLSGAELLRRIANDLEQLAQPDVLPAIMLADIGEIGMNDIQRHFDEQKAPDGTPWKARAALKDWTAPDRAKTPAQKRRNEALRASRRAAEKAQRYKLLTRSSRLRRSMTYQVEPRRVVWGTNVSYAAVQNFGGRKSYVIKPRKPGGRLLFAGVLARQVKHPPLAARTFMGFSRQALAEMRRTMQEAAQDAIGTALRGGTR
jgi:phage gpG-like protein